MNSLFLLATPLCKAWARMRRHLRQMPECERFLAGAVDHCDLKQRMSRWEHVAAQVRAPW